VLFLDSQTHSLGLRQWCHASLALPLTYALEQLREGAGTLQVTLDGLLQQLALGATLLPSLSSRIVTPPSFVSSPGSTLSAAANLSMVTCCAFLSYRSRSHYFVYFVYLLY
jgi:hypothetical protein